MKRKRKETEEYAELRKSGVGELGVELGEGELADVLASERLELI